MIYLVRFTIYINDFRRATWGERGGRPPLPFFENRKKCLDFGGKKVLIVSILGLNLPFKEYLGEKAPKFSPAGPFFCFFGAKFTEVP